MSLNFTSRFLSVSKLEDIKVRALANSICQILLSHNYPKKKKTQPITSKICDIKQNIATMLVISDNDYKFIIDYFEDKDFYDLESIVLKRIRAALDGSKNHLLPKSDTKIEFALLNNNLKFAEKSI
jgi:hypothetical protein